MTSVSTTSVPAEVARRYFAAQLAGDHRGAILMMHPDIVWHQPGRHARAGKHVGSAAVKQLFAFFATHSGGTFRIVEAVGLYENDELVATEIWFTAQRQGIAMSMAGIEVLRIRGGLITEVWRFPRDHHAEQSFWT